MYVEARWVVAEFAAGAGYGYAFVVLLAVHKGVRIGS